MYNVFTEKEYFKDEKRLRLSFTSAIRERKIHSNEFWEILYIYEGHGELYANGRAYPLSAGHTVIIKPRTEYAVVSPPKKNDVLARICRCIFTREYFNELLTLYNEIFGNEPYSFSGFITARSGGFVCFADDDAQNIHNILWLAAHEYNHCKIGSQAIIDSSMLNLFISAARLYEHKLNSTPPTVVTNKSMEEIKKYIQLNFSRELTLDHLASQAHLSREHLSRSFKKYTGKTITEYLLEIRMERAKKMLHKSKTSVTDIAAYCGYQTVGNFQRMFKRYTGVSPSEYRKKRGKV